MSFAGGYRYTPDLQVLDSCRATQPVRLPPSMWSISSPLRWREWQASLAKHPDECFARFIVNGIKEGFRIGYDYRSRGCKSPLRNMQSAAVCRSVVNAHLAKECAEGRVLGPFNESVVPQLHVSRPGVVPKHLPGQWRLIVDLSSPKGHSVNDGISKDLCSLS